MVGAFGIHNTFMAVGLIFAVMLAALPFVLSEPVERQPALDDGYGKTKQQRDVASLDSFKAVMSCVVPPALLCPSPLSPSSTLVTSAGRLPALPT